MTSPRIERLENRGWTFAFGEHPEAVEPGFDDRSAPGWYDVTIPHSFGLPAGLETDFYVGAGWYRHTLEVDDSWIGRHIELRFAGAFQHLSLYVNGHPAGIHAGGYTTFALDITPYVVPGANQLTVRVDNEWDARLAPRAGEHVFNGGIYRDVSVVVAAPTRIDWYGVGITTPDASRERAGVAVTTDLVNDSARPETIVVRHEIRDGDAVAAEILNDLTLAPHSTTSIEQRLTLTRPRLWSPATPELYRLRTTLEREGEVIDQQDDEFGVRWFSFSAQHGFTLNDEPFLIDGANVHQDHAGWGDAITQRAIAEDAALIKEAGLNFIRGSHYPHHEALSTACDRLGLLLWCEAPFWGTGGPKREGFWTASSYPPHEEDRADFEQSCLDAVDAMIRVNRNHPSVIAWATGNEVFFCDVDVIEHARVLTRRLVERIRELDPTRPAAVGGAQRAGFDRIGDLAGYNGDGASLFPDPGVPSIVSEYGSVVEDRPGRFGDRYTDGVGTTYPWRSGRALWAGFHHGSIFADMGRMGFIDHHRLPLASYYWYRQDRLGVAAPEPARSGEPARIVLRSSASSFSTDGTDEVRLDVELVDADGHLVDAAPDVLLSVTEGDGRFPSGRSLLLSASDGSLLAGRGAIRLRAEYAGPIRVVATSPGLDPADVELVAVGGERWDGRAVRFADGPPSRRGVPADDELSDIAVYRPVFAHGTLGGRTAAAVTDPFPFHEWEAEPDAQDPWLLVDLEGPRSGRVIEVRRPEDAGAASLAVSVDGRAFVPLRDVPAGIGRLTVDVPQETGPFRYVRLAVDATTGTTAVRRISVLA